MLKVFNLTTNEELHFDEHTAPEYAVRYAYCIEQRPELASWFFSRWQDTEKAEIEARLPLTIGKTSIACGDWGCLTGALK